MSPHPHELDGKLEPEAKPIHTCISDAALLSIAVSMKRIADLLDGTTFDVSPESTFFGKETRRD